MDIKDLNRSQFTLLLLLLMLVTSITTATVTVTLMDQSPKIGVGDTINRVVERVVPGATTTIVQIVKEVDKGAGREGESIAKAAAVIEPALVRVELSTDKNRVRLGTAFLVREGLVATALSNIPGEVGPGNLQITRGLGVWPAKIVLVDRENKVALLSFEATSTLPLVAFNYETGLPTTGETSVSFAYADGGDPEISMGIIMGEIKTSGTASSTDKIESSVIRTSSVNSGNIGGPVINPKGDLVGIAIARGYALSAKTLKAIIDQVK